MSVLRYIFPCLFVIVAVPSATHARAATLHVGAASCDITPDTPSFLAGQFSPRVSQGVEYPLTANVLALESRDGDKPLDSAIIISVDTAVVRASILLPIRAAVQGQLPGCDLGKLIVAATHTHSAPPTGDGHFKQQEGVQVPSDYVKFAAARIGAAAQQAWNGRRPARFSYGLGHAVVAYNRRAVYADGAAVMYGPTDAPRFRALEGMEDHDVNTMFFWDTRDKLLAIVVNVSCPSQEVESNRLLSSDYWGPTREMLKEKYGRDVTIVGLCGAAGDQSQPPADAPEDDTSDWLYASSGTYLPSERAVKGGGYGAVIQSNLVGPEGGQMLVEETVKMINAMW